MEKKDNVLNNGDVIESIVVNVRPSDEKSEIIKNEIKDEDYMIIIRSLNNGEKFTVGFKFTAINKETNKPEQYGNFIECSGEDLHEAIDLLMDQCKAMKEEFFE